MKIQLKKFGEVLISRPTGKDAYIGFLPTLKNLSENENLEVDFEGVFSLSPSWADEFLTPMLQNFGNRLFLIKSQNPSVLTTIEILEETNNYKFQMS
ncbi:MAG: hypothetical protein UW63_C0050G0004 [Candidatus Uhrbacteria bacterium GW2011_GWF2_44_350]|uniref:DUF4325 domain-containing protein n=1 Tax=Candidatus Uhrbacteria bacterium GW2011_GWF2_44_350 TaxID=1619000 RepID=A0A0G1JED5_9BACT|nr:MAG: hypothetical protein UW63_C0050G0004 [Candidatus Uhrbacteria bacterium GW2011_GWF2_44_350]HBR81060.1 hypothetical protein [Candidatus Uhrbacteria bacterium]